jgi:hypothetical protein
MNMNKHENNSSSSQRHQGDETLVKACWIDLLMHGITMMQKHLLLY